MSDSPFSGYLPVTKRGVQSTGPQLRGNFVTSPMRQVPASPCSVGFMSSPFAGGSFFGSPKLCYDSTPSMLLYPSNVSNFKSNTPVASSLWDVLGPLRSPTAFGSSFADGAAPSREDFVSCSTRIGADYTPTTQTPLASHTPLMRPVSLPPHSPPVLSRLPRGQSWYFTTMADDDSEFQSVNEAVGQESDDDYTPDPKLNRIVEEPDTTLMLRNVPNKYTREMLLEEIREHGLLEEIDFFYVPIDMRQQRNVGYCFINLTSADGVRRFRYAFDGAKLGRVETGKVCVVDVGKVQGLEANVNAYRNAAVMSMNERYQPLLLDKGVVQPFPPPTMTRAQLRNLKPAKKGVSKRKDGRVQAQKQAKDDKCSSTGGNSARYLRTANYRKDVRGDLVW